MRTGFDVVELHNSNSQLDIYSDYVRWRNANDPRKLVGYHAVATNIEPGKNPLRQAIDTQLTDIAWTGEHGRAQLQELARGG